MRVGAANWYTEAASRWFIGSAVALLVITAAAKAVAASGEARVLAQPDPLLGFLSMRQTMLLVAGFEVAVVSLVLRELELVRKAVLLAWIGVVFLLYRVGLWWIGFEGFCRCLGNLGDAFGIQEATADWVAKLILGYLLAGSGMIVLWRGIGQRLSVTRASRAVL